MEPTTTYAPGSMWPPAARTIRQTASVEVREPVNGRTRRKPPRQRPHSGRVLTTRPDPDVWARAQELADGRDVHLHTNPNGSVEVRNGNRR